MALESGRLTSQEIIEWASAYELVDDDSYAQLEPQEIDSIVAATSLDRVDLARHLFLGELAWRAAAAVDYEQKLQQELTKTREYITELTVIKKAVTGEIDKREVSSESTVSFSGLRPAVLPLSGLKSRIDAERRATAETYKELRTDLARRVSPDVTPSVVGRALNLIIDGDLPREYFFRVPGEWVEFRGTAPSSVDHHDAPSDDRPQAPNFEELARDIRKVGASTLRVMFKMFASLGEEQAASATTSRG